MKNIKASRRNFLKKAGLLTLGVGTVPASLLKLNLLNAAASQNNGTQSGDYKALVCFFFLGGNDSYNMLVPKSTAAYNEYADTRSNLALSQNSLLGLNGSVGGTTYGVNNEMPGIQNLYNSGKLAFVNNIGTLVTPMTKTLYKSGNALLPLGMFSHSDQTKHWQTALPNERGNIGWGGKMADMLNEMNNNDLISMNITLSGSNIFEFGDETINFSIDPYNIINGIRGYTNTNNYFVTRRKLIDSLLAYNYDNVFEENYKQIVKGGLDAQLYFKEIINNVPNFNTNFTDNRISKSFSTIAKVIAAREELGFKRQIFYVGLGGFDNHDNLIASHGGRMEIVNNAMSEFSEVLEELDVFNDVTCFTMSEFSRTLTSNGDGSDHAWGGNVMVMGGAVNGGQMFGEYPSLAIDNPLDLGRGRMIPTVSTDEYFAELALWFGVPVTELVNIFPNLGNFYNVNSGNKPIGFLNY